MGIDKKKIMTEAIEKYGQTVQKAVAMEEMGELIMEISKNIRGLPNKSHLCEEIADVSIVLDELKIMFGLSDEDIEDEITFKLVRLNNRLKEGD